MIRVQGMDAIVVLGARVRPDGFPSMASYRRIEHAARAYNRGLAPILVPSGGRRWHGQMEALCMRRVLMDLEVPEDAIVLEPFALTTAENAYFTARLAKIMGWQKLGIVTCPWHIPRAIQDFRTCGTDVIPLPTDPAISNFPTRMMRAVKERIGMQLDCLRLQGRGPW